jgi:hypothetical protein
LSLNGKSERRQITFRFLLDTSRRFRQQIPSVMDAEQAKKNQAEIDLLDSWLNDDEDSTEQQQAWEFLKTAL